MLNQTIGSLLPIGLATALSPFPVVAVVLILAGRRATVAGPAFAAGWVLGVGAITAVAGVLVDGDSSGGEPSTLVTWLRILGGLALLAAAARRWRNRPKDGEPGPMPGWMASVDTATPGRAVVLGLLVSAANPKIIAFAAAAASIIGQAGMETGDAVIAGVVYVVLSSIFVVGAVLLRVIGGDRSARPLDRLKHFMITNNDVIMMIVLGLIGAKVLGDGIAGL